MKFCRYAIFYCPADGPLATFSAAWLGWDPVAGKSPPAIQFDDLPLPWDEITRTPRKYGFHGTIKPPFRLSDGQDSTELQQALAAFCAARPPVALPAVELARLGRFLALVPIGDTVGLNRLAADAVRVFDRFRAPPSAQEIARRRTDHLSPRQVALLESWGYPYVMEEFRFHLTLTGKIPKAKAAGLCRVLDPLLSPLLPRPFVVDSLCLMGEGPDGMFHRIARFPLSGAG